ncbi:MAG: hypothetical protein AB4368_04380 [Xenococcaceae cyanobacterium]
MNILPRIKYFKKSNNNLSLIISSILFTFLLTSVATANVAPAVLFQPPSEEEQPESTEGAASYHRQQYERDFFGSYSR